MITLKTLPQATRQEVFDQVAEHLLTQNKKAKNANGQCVYYTHDGLRCAAGCLMSPEEHEELVRTHNHLFGWHRLVAKGKVPALHAQMIVTLQEVHDMNNPHNWYRELNILAGEWGLSKAVLEAF